MENKDLKEKNEFDLISICRICHEKITKLEIERIY